MFSNATEIMQVLQGNAVISSISMGETMKYHIRKGFICWRYASRNVPVSLRAVFPSWCILHAAIQRKSQSSYQYQSTVHDWAGFTHNSTTTIISHKTPPPSTSGSLGSLLDFFKPLFYLSMLFFYAMRFSRVIKYKYTGACLICWGKDSSSQTVRKCHHALRDSQTEKTFILQKR